MNDLTMREGRVFIMRNIRITDKQDQQLQQGESCIYWLCVIVFFVLICVWLRQDGIASLADMETSNVRVVPAAYINPYANGKDFGCGDANLCVLGWRVL
jgi:hypothetical protein